MGAGYKRAGEAVLLTLWAVGMAVALIGAAWLVWGR